MLDLSKLKRVGFIENFDPKAKKGYPEFAYKADTKIKRKRISPVVKSKVIGQLTDNQLAVKLAKKESSSFKGQTLFKGTLG